MKQNVEQVLSAQLTRSSFIPCNDDKVPIKKHKTGAEAIDYAEALDYENLSITLDRDIVVFDFDDENHAKKILNILEYLNIKTLCIETERGVHVYFKTDKTFQDKKVTLSIGLQCDIKSGKNNGQVIIRQNNVWRKAIHDVPIAKLPEELFVMVKDTITELDTNRNEQLHRYVGSLNTNSAYKSISTETKKKVLEVCNKFSFDERLSDDEFETAIRKLSDKEVIRDKMHYSKENINSFCLNAINKLCIKSYNSQLYFWYNNKYISDDNKLKGLIQTIDNGIVSSELFTTIEYIKNHLILHEAKPLNEFISFKNCILDLNDKKKLPHSPEFFIICNLPINYNDKANNEKVLKFLLDISDENQGIFDLLCQMLGYILFDDNCLQKAFILLGNGSNGKSLLLSLIKKVIGDKNCSNVELQDFEKVFDITEALDCMINVGEEVSRRSLENLTNFKKITSGGDVQGQRKFGQPFTIKTRVKLMFAANSLPKSKDTTEAFFSRLVIVPFKRTFMRGTKNCDPNLESKLSTEENLSALFNVMLDNYYLLKKEMRFIDIPESEDALLTYRYMLDPILQWFGTLEKREPGRRAYSNFQQYCEYNGITDKIDANTFTNRYLELCGDAPENNLK